MVPKYNLINNLLFCPECGTQLKLSVGRSGDKVLKCQRCNYRKHTTLFIGKTISGKSGGLSIGNIPAPEKHYDSTY